MVGLKVRCIFFFSLLCFCAAGTMAGSTPIWLKFRPILQNQFLRHVRLIFSAFFSIFTVLLTADVPSRGSNRQEPVQTLSDSQILASVMPPSPAPQVATPSAQPPAAPSVTVAHDDSVASSELLAVLSSAGLVPASCRQKLMLTLLSMGIGSEAALAATLSRDPAFLEQV